MEKKTKVKNGFAVFVYLISDGETPLYVGASVRPQNRFRWHLTEKFKNHKNKRNLKMSILQKCDKQSIFGAEKKWILYYKKKNPNLLNKNENGHNGKCTNDEYENIKVSSAVLDKVRKHKEDTRVPIIVFVETAIEEKLSKAPKK